MRKGFTLTETVAVLSIVGILAAIATPPALRLRDSLAVHEAARQIATAHQRARFMAIMHHRTVVLTISADSIAIRPRNGTERLWWELGAAAGGVTLIGPLRNVTFSPIGYAVGAANATYTVTRGAARRSVVVSRLGRVRMKP